MCTVIVVNHHYKGFPLVIAANRDEQYGKPSSSIQPLSHSPLIIGGKDDVKGGTWFGVNEHSLFATGTNQGTTDSTIKTSRGHIILEALKSKSLDEMLSFVEEINPAKYNKFNLVFGNSKAVFIAHSYMLHSMVIRELPYGIHIISSDMKFKGEDSKVSYIHRKLDGVVDVPWLEYYGLLKKILASTEYGVKVNQKKLDGKAIGRCTRSSTIAAFGDSLERYKFFDRTAPRPKKSKDEPAAPRYKDYVELLRNPGGNTVAVSEESGEADEELSPKEVIMNTMLQRRGRSDAELRELLLKVGGMRLEREQCTCKKWRTALQEAWEIEDRRCPVHGDGGGNDFDVD